LIIRFNFEGEYAAAATTTISDLCEEKQQQQEEMENECESHKSTIDKAIQTFDDQPNNNQCCTCQGIGATASGDTGSPMVQIAPGKRFFLFN
jgi:hypothetical protein